MRQHNSTLDVLEQVFQPYKRLTMNGKTEVQSKEEAFFGDGVVNQEKAREKITVCLGWCNGGRG